jgi:hypothetical protein
MANSAKDSPIKPPIKVNINNMHINTIKTASVKGTFLFESQTIGWVHTILINNESRIGITMLWACISPAITMIIAAKIINGDVFLLFISLI